MEAYNSLSDISYLIFNTYIVSMIELFLTVSFVELMPKKIRNCQKQ